MTHILQTMAPARAKAAATEYLAGLITGQPSANLAAQDVMNLPTDERTPRALVEALTPSERPSMPWFTRAAFRDLISPTTKLLIRAFPLPFHRAFCRTIPVEDFQERNVLFGINGFSLEPSSENGEIRVNSGEPATFETVTIQPKTVARIVQISRELFHGDTTLGYFKTATEALIRSAYQHEATAIFSLLEAGATLPDAAPWFCVTNSVSDALAPVAIGKGLQLLASQSLDGVGLDLQPAVLVLPAGWSIKTDDLPADVWMAADAGRLQVYRSGRVTSGYFFADPAMAPAVGLAGFGDILPLIDTRSGPSESRGDWGMELRRRHDYGVAALSRVGLVKMTVA